MVSENTRPHGYILFVYYEANYGKGQYKNHMGDSSIEIVDELFYSNNDLREAWRNHWDEKWDIIDRDMIHYFYLNLKSGEYAALPRWAKKYKPRDGNRFSYTQKTVLSTIQFPRENSK